MKIEPITVQVTIKAPIRQVWEKWTTPQDVMAWNSASEDWHTPQARNDLRVGGTFVYRMASRDGASGFDFSGVYYEVIPEKRVAYKMADGRKVTIQFDALSDGVQVSETFDLEQENTAELQRAGWQAILDHFKRYVEKS